MDQYYDPANISVSMSDKDFKRLSTFIEKELGIQMPPVKKSMLESRLGKRLRMLRFSSYTEYVDFVFSEEGSTTELLNMIDAVTTNKTDFFRETDHFEFLLHTYLPGLQKTSTPLRIWSAGCATGEEPYSLAIVMEEYRRSDPRFLYSILATDVSIKALQTAVDAIYDEEKIANLPFEYKKRYFLKSKDTATQLVRIRSELRSKVQFERFNLMEDVYNLPYQMDIIFCRNVIIYFNRSIQQNLISKLYTVLKPEGLLFLGHSETITGIDIPLKNLAPTIYQKG